MQFELLFCTDDFAPQTLQKEVTRQMADSAEIQRLRIANLRLKVENAKIEEFLQG